MHRRTRLIVRRTVRQALIWILFPTILVVAIWLIWGWHAAHRLPATIARIHAQGIHLYPEDFPDDAAIPHDQNAYYDLIDEIHPMVWGKGEGDLISKTFAEQTVAEHAQIQAMLASRQKLIDKIDAAQSRSTVLWPRDVFTEKWQHDHLPLTGWVIFGRLLLRGAELAHAEGDDMLALRDLRRLITLAQIFEQSPIVIQHLAGGAFRGGAAYGIESMNASLSLRNPEVATEAGQLIKSLLDDQPSFAGLRNAQQGYMTSRVQFYTNRDLLKLLGRVSSWERRLMQETWARDLDADMEVLAAMGSPNWQQAKIVLTKAGDPVRYSDLGHSSYLDAIVKSGSSSPTMMFETTYTSEMTKAVEDRAAVLLLAAQLYKAQRGQLPTSSAELVPGILPYIPIDPFDGEGRPLHYRLDPGGPTVWSVGENGRDDNGVPGKSMDLVLGAGAAKIVPLATSTRPVVRRPMTRSAATKPQAVMDRTATATKPATQ